MIEILVVRGRTADVRPGIEQDPEGLLEPAGAVTSRDECGVDGPL
jgi:hypothetical protein